MALKFDEPTIKKAKETLYASLSGWIVLGYSDANTVTLQSKSDRSEVSEMVKELKDDQIQYCLVRLDDSSKDSVVARQDGKQTTKDVFIVWQGPAVRQIEKGKKQGNTGTVSKFLQPFHAELTAVNRDNFTEEVVRDKASPLSGSHVID